MQIRKIRVLLTIILMSIMSYYFGQHREAAKLESNKAKEQNQQLSKIDFSSLSSAEARQLLTQLLDLSKIPHGDLSIPGNVISSKRYIISQWQRVAVGSIVTIFAYDPDGDLAVALGVQRGVLRTPQGYMEAPLPKEDLSGIREKGGSRLNAKTGEIVAADRSIEENAVREVKEEIGLAIIESDLNLLGVLSLVDESPVAVAIEYYVKLDHTAALKTVDDEFSGDDMQSPRWVKIKDIKFNPDKKNYFTPNSEFPVEARTMKSINKVLEKISPNLMLKPLY